MGQTSHWNGFPVEQEGRNWRQQLYTCFKRFIVKGRREMLQKLAQRGSFFFLRREKSQCASMIPGII